MKRATLARVLLARLLGGSLSQGSPFGYLSFEVRRDKIGVVKSFYFSGKSPEKNSWTCKNPEVSTAGFLQNAPPICV
jgi:hypothetical protein